jgi:hypothetical protein
MNPKYFSKHHLEPWGLELVAKYPLIFTEPDDSNVFWANQAKVADDDYVNLRYGFECAGGWKDIIETIARTGSELVTHLRQHGYPDAFIHSCIVKEKFGVMAWQEAHSGLPPLFNVLWRAFVGETSNQSAYTCELSGDFGRLRKTKGGKTKWNRTLSVAKALELGYDIEEWEKEKLKQ